MHAPADAHPDDRVQQRLTELEIKASFAADLVYHPHEIVARHQQHTEPLARQLQEPKPQQGSGDARRATVPRLGEGPAPPY